MSLSFNSSVELNDSDILKLEKGPVNYAKNRQGSRMNIDQFVKDLEEQTNRCGFTCQVKVYDTEQPEVYAFEVEINGRTLGSVFDPDRQVHEVTSNLLQLPGEKEGFIPSRDALQKLLDGEGLITKGAKKNHIHTGKHCC